MSSRLNIWVSVFLYIASPIASVEKIAASASVFADVWFAVAYAVVGDAVFFLSL